jgi:hypothetical protein
MAYSKSCRAESHWSTEYTWRIGKREKLFMEGSDELKLYNLSGD